MKKDRSPNDRGPRPSLLSEFPRRPTLRLSENLGRALSSTPRTGEIGRRSIFFAIVGQQICSRNLTPKTFRTVSLGNSELPGISLTCARKSRRFLVVMFGSKSGDDFASPVS